MDTVDTAQANQQHHIDQQLQKHSTNKPSGVSAKFCGCGAPIPAKRRKSLPGVQECVECVTIQEIKDRNYR